MNILLTGATGSIGGELANKLTSAGHAVVALVRKNRGIYANDGRMLAATDFDLDFAMPKAGCLSKLTGDVTLSRFGLMNEPLCVLRSHIDLVIHCAATTDFNASDAVYRAVNIGGVLNALDVVPDARFLHVSTAYVCGLQDGPIAERRCPADQIFTNGYERSKAAGEELVLAAGKRAVIARPSIVVGASDDGSFHQQGSFYKLFRLIAEGHITELPAAAGATLDFVPIDHVVGGLLDIVDNWDKAEGKVIHLTSGGAIPVSLLAKAIALFGHLDPPKFLEPGSFSTAQMAKAERRLYQQVATFYESYFQRSPEFDTTNLRDVSGRVCPAVDLAALKRMIEYCIKTGFIRDSRPQTKVTSPAMA